MVSLKVFLDQTYRVRIPDAEASAEAFDGSAWASVLLTDIPLHRSGAA
jgi:hypothetical protein